MNSRANTEAAIIDMSEGDAGKKLQHMVTFAHEGLPEVLRKRTVRSSSVELALDNGSFCLASASSRGGTPQIMLVSELGKIAHADPKRAEEIQTGAIPSVPGSGLVVIESTAMGRNNFFHATVKKAQEIDPARRTEADWSLCFGAWFEDAAKVLSGPAERVSRDTGEYLDELERRAGVKLSLEQRVWYQVNAVEGAGIFRFREFPSSVDECFKAPIEGAIYGDEIARLRAAGKIYNFEYDRAFPVYCSWDIGWNDTCDVWWWQLRGNRMDVIRHVTRARHSAGMMANVVREAGIAVAEHYLPHDAGNATAASGKDYLQALREAGILNVKRVQRIPDIWIGINQVRDMLPRCSFNAGGCAEGLAALEAYHEKEGKPVHDWSSHPADGLRTGVEAINAGMVSDASVIARRAERRDAGRVIHAWEESGVAYA